MYRSLISLSLLLTMVTVVLSAYIRLADVGIGCEPWPACYAHLDPAAEKKGITVLTESGRDMAHYGARVAHRYIASALGLFIVAIFFMALRRVKDRATSLLVPAGILAITICLSLLGYYTPSRSNPLITMGNLLGGMAMLGLLWWLMQREAEGAEEVPEGISKLRPLAWLAFALVVLQIVLGGWSSANFASASCPGLVSCEGEVLDVPNLENAFDPLRKIALDENGQVMNLDAVAALSMTHRLFALLTAGYLAWLVRRARGNAHLAGTLIALSVFSISQLAVGIGSVWFQVPLLLLTLHNALAACLLLACINLLHRLAPPAVPPPPG